MKLKTAAALPQEWKRGYMESLFKKIDDQVNNLTDGKVNAVTNSYTAAPTSGTHAIGDFVRNTNTVQNGTAPSNYVILGWICTLGGTPGTFTEVRADATGAISVGGPGASTDNAIARWDGTGGNVIQNSVVTIGDTGVMAGASIALGSNTLTGTLAQFNTSVTDADLASYADIHAFAAAYG